MTYAGGSGNGYGFGPYRGTMAGFPHFKEAVFEGSFPFAKITFEDPCFPGKMMLRAFNPFIPLNDFDSSLPAALFEVTAENTSKETVDYSVVLSVNNPFPYGTTVNEGVDLTEGKGILMTGTV